MYDLKTFNLQSCRYVGNKAKLTDWIFSIIEKETKIKAKRVCNLAILFRTSLILADDLFSDGEGFIY